MAIIDGFVQVANGAHAQDVLPAVVLLEDAKHLVLHHNLTQFLGMLYRRNAQQQTIIVFLQAKEIDLRGASEQGAIEIVVILVDIIERGIERADTLQ